MEGRRERAPPGAAPRAATRMPRLPRLATMPGQERQPPPARVDPPSGDPAGAYRRAETGAGAPWGAPAPLDLATVASAPVQPDPSFHGPLTDWPAYWWLSRAGVPFAYRDLALGGRAFGGPDQVGRPSFVVGDRARRLIIEVAEPAWTARASLEKQAGTTRVATLKAAGYQVVGVRPEHLQTELGDTMTAALAGVQRFAGLH